MPGESPRGQVKIDSNSIHIQHCSRGGRLIDIHYASLASQGVQHRVIYLDGHPSRYQPRPTELNFGEQTGTGVWMRLKMQSVAYYYKTISMSVSHRTD